VAIPEAQLVTWSRPGASAGSRDTYAIVKNVLESANSPFSEMEYKVFLQGSYGNDTNVRGEESDVDIVISLDTCFLSDRELLDAIQNLAWVAAHPTRAEYGYFQFKADVLAVLKNAFPGAVTSGDKAFSIEANGNRRKADVLPCIKYRRYYKFNSVYDQSSEPGICFYDKTLNLISNYPVQHSEYLTEKHQSSGELLKPMIRVMKNLRNRLVADGLLKRGVAPSYYLEGLLCNVPREKFSNCYGDTFCAAINWLQQEADRTKLVTANRQFYLLRDGFKTTWPTGDYDAFIGAAIELWNKWAD
jgi:hypothetical protein